MRKAAIKIEKKGGSLAEYRPFILDFCEKAVASVANNTINLYIRVILFLIAFSDKVGDLLYKKCNIDLANPPIMTNVFVNLKREALIICVNKDF